MQFKRLCYILSATFLSSTVSFAEKPTDLEIRAAVTAKTNHVRRLIGFKELQETEDWYIFGYIAILAQDDQGPKNLYVYVPKDDELSKIKIRVHGFLPFPFPSVTYSQFQHFLNDPSALDEVTSHFSGEAVDDFKKRFINSLKLDFATDRGYERFFEDERNQFERFKNEYVDALDQIEKWDEIILKSLKGNLTRPIPDEILTDPDFADYERKIATLGIDLVLRGVTDSSCTECFMMVTGYTPADNYSGFLWIKDETKLPKWDPNGIFFRKSLGEGWYIFRST